VVGVVEYLAEATIDDRTGQQLWDVLNTRFIKPQDYVFRERRYPTPSDG
jgi:hypothetical protein